MSTRGRVPGQRQDPEAMIDAALGETFAEIAAQGSGVDAEDVVRTTEQRRERPQRRTRPAEREERTEQVERDDQGRFLPRRQRRSRSQADDVDPYDVLEADEESQPQAETRRRRPTRTSERRREIEDDDEDEDDDAIYDDDDEDEDDDEDDVRPARRRRAVAEEDEDEEDDLDPEGNARLEDGEEDDDDEAEEAQPRRRNRPGRRKRYSKRIQSEIDREAKRIAGTTIQERDALREQEEQRIRADTEAAKFLSEALGTPEIHQQLKAVAYNTQLPARQRDDAIKRLAAYERNSGFFEKYKSGAWAVIRYEQAQEDTAALKAIADLRPLDPKVLAEGDRAKTLVHAYATGRALGQQEAAREIKRLKRELANAKGSREDRRYRNGISGRRPTVASANGRRANGRVGQPDLLRTALGNDRGIGGDGQTFAAPTEEVLAQLRRGDITLADLRLGKLAI